MFCDDPLRDYLNDLGYAPLKLPIIGKSLLKNIIYFDGENPRIFGNIIDILDNEEVSEKIKRIRGKEDKHPDISGKFSEKFDFNIGFTILKPFWSVDRLRIKDIFSNAKKMSIFFLDVYSRHISFTKLKNYLDNTKIRKNYRDWEEFFIINSELMAKELLIGLYDEDGKEIELNSDIIKNVFSSDVKVELSSNKKILLKYKGKGKCIFAVSAFKIEINKYKLVARPDFNYENVLRISPYLLEDYKAEENIEIEEDNMSDFDIYTLKLEKEDKKDFIDRTKNLGLLELDI